MAVASLLTFVGYGSPSVFGMQPSGDGLFSVSEGKQVRFAPGNLVYDSADGYRFTDHQYDYGGLFGWGTGSYPMLVSMNDEDYLTFDDWGGHIDGGWHTLSIDEWVYVIWGRPNATAKRGTATVCGVHGLVLLPDSWSGGTFHSDTDGWNMNVYEASSWSNMEAAGAVFLPAAGFRYGTEMSHVGMIGGYWSSSPNFEDFVYYIEDFAYDMNFYEDGVHYFGYYIRYFGRSVRLVQDY